MGRQRESGFFGTLFKSVFGVGTTVHYRTTWTGKKQKVVTHHDSGKKKTYTHNDGFFGNKTTTRTTQDGREIERGVMRRGFFGRVYEEARKTDGTDVHRRYESGFFRDHVTTQETGTCHGCEGTGERAYECRNCTGTGLYHIDAKSCFKCEGTGVRHGKVCEPCSGTGFFREAKDLPCRHCQGTGTFRTTCKKCEGTGEFRRRTRD